jgi:hypothetical protein
MPSRPLSIPMADQLRHDSGARAGDHAEAVEPLSERAAMAARAELRGERSGILGAIGQATLAPLVRARHVPERWSLIWMLSHFQ